MSVHKKILEKHGVVEQTTQSQQIQANSDSLVDNDEKQLNQLLQESFSSNSSYIRATTSVFPKTRAAYQQAKFPFGVHINLCGPSVPDGFPSTSFGNLPILRCTACRAYLNPFMSYLKGGSMIQCNICDNVDPLLQEYQSPLDCSTGKREDYLDRVELNQASYDIRAGQEYQARPPMPPTYFFMIDVSQQSQEILPLFCSVLKQAIKDNQLQGGERTMFGLLTFDEVIHIYNLQPGLKMPQMYVLSDPTENSFPIPDDLLVNLKESQDQIVSLLDQLENMFKSTRSKFATQFSRALELSQKIFSHVGGKLFIITSSYTITKEVRNYNYLQKPPFISKLPDDQKNYMLPSNPQLCCIAGTMHCQFISPTLFIFSTYYMVKLFINITNPECNNPSRISKVHQWRHLLLQQPARKLYQFKNHFRANFLL